MIEYIYNLGVLILSFSLVMIPVCIILGIASAIIECIWPEGGKK